MKREIEFRGRTAKGEWVYGDLVRIPNGDSFDCYIISDFDERDTFYDLWKYAIRVIPETVGQYIGVTDKNGKKVYEGDVVKVYYFNNEYVGKVVFNERTCGFEFWYKTVVGAYGEKATHKMNFAQFDKCEVIGNIFDKESDNGD